MPGGTWDIVAGSYRGDRYAVPGHYEVLTAMPTTRVVLRRRTDSDDAGTVLYASHTSTEAMSIAANVDNAYWKAAHFFTRALRQLEHGGESPDTAMPALEVVRSGTARHAFLLLRKLLNKVERKLREIACNPQWLLGVRRADAVPGAGDESTFQLLQPPRDRLWADPFVITRDDRTWVFFEDMPFATNRGEIAVAELTDTGVLGPVQTVLACNYHLSYPFLLEYGGELYMVPETYDNERVDLYRCVEFPARWEFQKTLLHDVRAARCDAVRTRRPLVVVRQRCRVGAPVAVG